MDPFETDKRVCIASFQAVPPSTCTQEARALSDGPALGGPAVGGVVEVLDRRCPTCQVRLPHPVCSPLPWLLSSLSLMHPHTRPLCSLARITDCTSSMSCLPTCRRASSARPSLTRWPASRHGPRTTRSPPEMVYCTAACSNAVSRATDDMQWEADVERSGERAFVHPWLACAMCPRSCSSLRFPPRETLIPEVGPTAHSNSYPIQSTGLSALALA